MDYNTKVSFGLLALAVFLETSIIVQSVIVTTSKPKLYITSPKPKDIKSHSSNRGSEQNLVNENVLPGNHLRNSIFPLWPTPANQNDQIRQNSNFNLRHPVKTTVDPILSAKQDTLLTDQEYLQNLNVPATYESIVYNPHSKEATSAFSISNFWETPELSIKDVNQRQDGGNSLVTTSSRLEYTPGSHQTPLNQIQYRERFSDPYRRPTIQPVYENQNENLGRREENVEEEDDDSEKQEVDEENDELQERGDVQENEDVQVDEDAQENEEIQENEEDSSENEKNVHLYPVNLDTRSPFNPFENVQEPNDIYSDVLNSIGSVFNDDHSSLPPQETTSNIKTFNSHSGNSLLPEFEQYSYENLQQKQIEEDERENVADNEDVAEYEDDDEGKESKAIPLKKAKEEVSRSPLNTVPPPKSKPEKKLKESPFPSVKIINNKPEKQENSEKPTLRHESSLPFSPWLPTQAPFKQRDPTPWPNSIPKSEKPIYQSWPKVAETKQKNSYKEPITTKPYTESYRKSYNKSWKTSSPDKDENSSYKSSWKFTEPEKRKNLKKNEKVSKKPKKSSKILRQSSSHVEKVVRRMEEPRNNTSREIFFVTPVPTREIKR